MDEAKNAKVDIKELQVRRELGQLDFAIERLDKTVSVIVERLKCVSRDGPTKGEEVTKEPQPLVEIAQKIKGKSNYIDKMNDRLVDVIAGLEI